MKIFIHGADQFTDGDIVVELCEFYNGDFCLEIEDSTDVISVKGSKIDELIFALEKLKKIYSRKLVQRVEEFPIV